MNAWKILAKRYRARTNNLMEMNVALMGENRELQARLAQTPEEQQKMAEGAWLAGMSRTWYDKLQSVEAENRELHTLLKAANENLDKITKSG